MELMLIRCELMDCAVTDNKIKCVFSLSSNANSLLTLLGGNSATLICFSNPAN